MTDRASVRVALRTLSRHRGFTVVAIVSLAVAIALNTTMYSVLDAMIRPKLDVRKPENIYWLRYFSNDSRRDDPAAVERALRVRATGFEGVTGTDRFAFATREPLIENGARYKRTGPSVVRPNFFQFLGTSPLQGRVFGPGDSVATPPPAVISEVLAAKLFPDESPVGRTITIDGDGYTVIGVVEHSSIFWPLYRDLWILRPPGARPTPITMIRLRDGVDLKVVSAELGQIAAQLALATGQPVGTTGFNLRPYEIRQFKLGQFHFALFGAVGAVLLVACANLANLQLARGLARTRELALRSAVGASRGQIISHLMTETVLLAIGGLALGIVLTFWGVHLVKSSVPPYMSDYMIEPRTSWRMLVFAAAAALVCLFLVGLLPALHVSRVDPNSLLKSGSGTGANREHRRRYGMMVVAQIGFALPVLIGAIVVFKEGLRLHSRDFVVRQWFGYDPAPLVSANVQFLSDTGGVVPAGAIAAEAASHIRQSAAVLEVAASFTRPPLNRPRGGSLQGHVVSVDDENGVVREEPAPLWSYNVVSPSYFRTFNLPMERGRDFVEGEFGRSVIVDQGTARFLWGSHNPIGRAIKFSDSWSAEPWYHVVGVAGDMRDTAALRRHDYTWGFRLAQVYRVITPDDTLMLRKGSFRGLTIYARVRGDVELAAVRIQRQMRQTSVRGSTTAVPLEDNWISYWRVRQDFVASLFGTFACLGLGLVAIGVYGIVSHSVAERRRELAVRLSLGATARNILRSVLREGVALILAGIAFGLLFTKYTVWWLASFMDEKAGYDALLFALISTVLFGIAAFAAFLPALRATRIDPVEALRHE